MTPIAVQDVIIIEQMEPEEVTKGGIVIPDAQQKRPLRGKVISVGSGKFSANGVLIPMQVKVGNIVNFGKNAIVSEFGEDGRNLAIMREADILFIEGA